MLPPPLRADKGNFHAGLSNAADRLLNVSLCGFPGSCYSQPRRATNQRVSSENALTSGGSSAISERMAVSTMV